MATFTYGTPGVDYQFDDRLLAHLRAVIVSKVRRSESFLFTWIDQTRPGEIQQSLWIHPAASMKFTIKDSASKPLNRAWLDVLTESSNSGFGLTLQSEPEPTAVPQPKLTPVRL